jgi:excisionase family DNA binding protein
MTTLATTTRINGSPAPDRLLTIREVAAWLAVSIRTVQRLVAAGAFPQPVRLGRERCVRWFVADVRQHLERRRKERAPW